jgi:hypothetical protein
MTDGSSAELLSVLLAAGLEKLDSAQIGSLLASYPRTDPDNLWAVAEQQVERSPLAREFMLAILEAAISAAPPARDLPWISWLTGERWRPVDTKVLMELDGRAPQCLPRILELGEDLPHPEIDRARVRIAAAVQKHTSPTPPSGMVRSDPATSDGGVLATFLIATLVVFAVFCLLPLDLPADVPLGSRVAGRLCEATYQAFGFFTVVKVGGALKRGWGIDISTIVYATLAAFAFLMLVFVVEHPITLQGQFLLAVYLGVGVVLVGIAVAIAVD